MRHRLDRAGPLALCYQTETTDCCFQPLSSSNNKSGAPAVFDVIVLSCWCEPLAWLCSVFMVQHSHEWRQ